MSHRQPLGSVAAAAHGTSPTPTTVASACRPSTEIAQATAVTPARRSSHLHTPAPAVSSPAATAALTSRATVVWTADPGTMRMM